MVLPSNAVLSVPQLLDRTLCLVDMRSLLVAAQLVSRDWHNLIVQSPSIQQVLHLQAKCGTSSERTPNPLPAELFPPFIQQILHLQPKQNTACERIQNPLLAELFPPWFDKIGVRGYKRPEFLRMTLTSNQDHVFLRENAT
ncbi:hypothetical protein BDP27DRAFT_1335987 [Rhodocollybia butyracea]|uniref:F-box domain-containing protein n=1 Tax=Rhodocollybia butyracea TaxID=206335 RepID=A0A9P5PFH4_9AGAR|nr:hypothetical protein BDP27DRAFT_1335987 [Rhodocollybia butyracea]